MKSKRQVAQQWWRRRKRVGRHTKRNMVCAKNVHYSLFLSPDKNYASAAIELSAFKNYANSLNIIDQHNNGGKSAFKMGTNAHSDYVCVFVRFSNFSYCSLLPNAPPSAAVCRQVPRRPKKWKCNIMYSMTCWWNSTFLTELGILAWEHMF